jgi:hypothetical protein
MQGDAILAEHLNRHSALGPIPRILDLLSFAAARGAVQRQSHAWPASRCDTYAPCDVLSLVFITFTLHLFTSIDASSESPSPEAKFADECRYPNLRSS